MEQKPGWTYRFISSLNMQIAINDTTGGLTLIFQLVASPILSGNFKSGESCR